jgi:hypothetical protein
MEQMRENLLAEMKANQEKLESKMDAGIRTKKKWNPIKKG